LFAVRPAAIETGELCKPTTQVNISATQRTMRVEWLCRKRNANGIVPTLLRLTAAF
jgi:hypothetical protein